MSGELVRVGLLLLHKEEPNIKIYLTFSVTFHFFVFFNQIWKSGFCEKQ